jgi:glycosyltransferase involved in cell wall biosynthesis
VRIAYLVNQYPKVSHSFIRREIQALERLGLTMQRFALRGWAEKLADAQDVQERARTRFVLHQGGPRLIAALVRTLVRRPASFPVAFVAALRLGRCSQRGVLRHIAYLAEACVLLEWCRTDGVEHVHAHFGTNSAAVAMLLRLLGGPTYSFTVHGPEEFDAPVALSLGDKVRHAAFVVAVSSFGRSQIYRWVEHVYWPKVRVVHCGIDRSFHSADPVPIGESQRLVCVGRLCEQKGQLVLIEAMGRLAAEGLACELVLAGDGELRAEVERLIDAHGLRSSVRITGWVGSERVREEIQAARALVLPSFAEGLPVVIMEAMALGRPVISTYIAGIPELVVPGESGWLVPAGDVDALVWAMRTVLEAEPAALDALGQRGRARVLARHDVDLAAAKLVAMFRESVRSDSAAAPAR